MNSKILFTLEVLIFFLSLCYILYYISGKIRQKYKNIKKIIGETPEAQDIKNKKTISIDKKDNPAPKTYKKQIKKLSSEQVKNLDEVTKKAKWNYEKWYFTQARNHIIEWLAIDKYNEELNIMLAWVYEKDGNLKNAIFVYKDLLEVHPSNTNILRKYGELLHSNKSFQEAFIVFEEVFNRDKTDREVIDTLTEIAHILEKDEKTLEYANLFLLEKPRDVRKNTLKARALKKLEKYKNASAAYKKVAEVQPYNDEAIEELKILEDLILHGK